MGFSHTHFSGTGHSDMGDILLMPFTAICSQYVFDAPYLPENVLKVQGSKFWFQVSSFKFQGNREQVFFFKTSSLSSPARGKSSVKK